MYQPAKLIYKSYIPNELEIGMLFAMSVCVNGEDYLHIHALEAIPRDIDLYKSQNGLPVKPYLIKAISSNPDVSPVVVAYPDQLGWIELEDGLYPFEIEDMNYISMNNDGYIYVYMEEDEAVLEDGKIVMSYTGDEWLEEEY